MAEKEVKLVKKKTNLIDKLKLEDLLTLKQATNMICEELETSLVANKNEPSFRAIYDKDLIEYNKYKEANKAIFKLIKSKLDSIIEAL